MELISKDKRAIERFETLQDDFIKVHNDRYDYSLVEYKNSHFKIKIICSEHGIFEQSTSCHLQGIGCPECGKKKRAVSRMKTNEQFIEEAKEKHGNRYDYSLVEYKGSHHNICIICKEHGEFWQLPIHHLKGSNCSKCSGNNKKTTEDFIEESNKIHNSKYDYSKTHYEQIFKKVKIICPIHGEFEQIPKHHLNGHGCEECSNELKNYKSHRIYFDKPTTLYYIKIEKEGFPPVWKIGLTTNNDILKRFSYDIRKGINITVLHKELFNNGLDALNKEQLIINSFKEFKYKGEKILKSGNSEIFTKDCFLINN